MRLTTSIALVRGVGPKTAEQFHLSGIETVGQLINFLPRKYEDFSEVTSIAELEPGKRTIKARVESTEVKRVRRGMTVVTAVLNDGTDKVKAVWFNQ